MSAARTGLPVPLPDAKWRRAFRRRLRWWYHRHARELPWRRRSDPYSIWVSEIMLQQTQVATVTSYFDRFLRAFPTIEVLAQADEHEVLRLWEGLGYYRRARQLHRAARILVEQHGGRFPRDPHLVRRLPGIGRYTAGAILSIAFDQPQPVLEANTKRLLSRVLAYRGDPGSADGQRLLWTLAETLLPRRGAGALNQALMELGSQVCLVPLPRCQSCPVAALCRARMQGLQTRIPPAGRGQRPQQVREAAVVVWRGGRVLLVRCPHARRWAGLWDFPRFELRRRCPPALCRELVDGVRERTGLMIKPGPRLDTIRHSVTRFRITLDCYQAEYVSEADGKAARRSEGNPAGPAEGVEKKWLRPGQLGEYPLNAPGRKLATLIASGRILPRARRAPTKRQRS